jgi:hypothetical protein
MVPLRPRFCGAFLVGGGKMELGKLQYVGLPMIYRDLEGRGGSRHYSRWAYWRPEDDWGPLTAAVMFLIILAGLVIYGGVQL